VTILETRRLAFRRLETGDLNDLARLYGDPVIRRYFPDGTRTYEQTRSELEWFVGGHPSHPELGLWATLHKGTGRLIGPCGLLPWTLHGRAEVEVAYLLDREWWGQGLGTEAAEGILSYGFKTLLLPRLICLIHPDNKSSRAVAARIGMTLEREFTDEDGPTLVYAATNPELSTRQREE